MKGRQRFHVVHNVSILQAVKVLYFLTRVIVYDTCTDVASLEIIVIVYSKPNETTLGSGETTLPQAEETTEGSEETTMPADETNKGSERTASS